MRLGKSIEYLAKAEDMADIRSIDGFVLLAAEQELLVGVVNDKPTAGSCCQVCQPLQMRDWQCHTCAVRPLPVRLSLPSYFFASMEKGSGASLQQDGSLQNGSL